jgi:hypothetical protein
MPLPVGAALLASADGYTPRANAALDRAREELGTIGEIANALADNLPAPKLTARKSRRRRRKRKDQGPSTAQPAGGAAESQANDGGGPETPSGQVIAVGPEEPSARAPAAEDAA